MADVFAGKGVCALGAFCVKKGTTAIDSTDSHPWSVARALDAARTGENAGDIVAALLAGVGRGCSHIHKGCQIHYTARHWNPEAEGPGSAPRSGRELHQERGN